MIRTQRANKRIYKSNITKRELQQSIIHAPNCQMYRHLIAIFFLVEFFTNSFTGSGGQKVLSNHYLPFEPF